MSGKVYNLSEKAMTEKYEDYVFTKVMALYAEEESAKILRRLEEEPFEADPKAIEKIYSKIERRENLSTVWKYSRKLLQFAAMVVFVAVVSVSSVVVASADAREAVAEAIYHLIIKDYGRYTQVTIGENTDFIDPEIYDWEGAYAPTYVPKGFSFGEMQDLDSQKIVTYFSETNFISFVQAQNVIQQADTENADRVEPIIVNNSEGLLVVKGELTSVTWNIGDTLFTVLGNYSTEELINMAQSIKPIEKYEAPAEEYEFVDPEIYDWEGAYAPTYIPERYIFNEKQELTTRAIITYSNGNSYFTITQSNKTASLHMDTEDADSVSEVIINNSQGILVEKDGFSSLAWNVDENFFWVRGEIESAELIEIAEGLKPLN